MAAKIIVVDSSVIVKWLNQENEASIDQADKLLRSSQLSKITLIAPELAKYEVGNVLLKGKGLSFDYASEVLAQFYILPIVYIEDSEVLAKEAYRIASEFKITYYDAAFMALAQKYDAALVTENVKHQGRSSELNVIALKDF